MAAPRRIQLRRTKGWRKPDGAIVCSRPGRFGNPHDWRDWREAWPFQHPSPCPATDETDRDRWCKEQAQQAYCEDLNDGTIVLPVDELRGHDLCCWCGPTDPCHVDVIIEFVNKEHDQCK